MLIVWIYNIPIFTIFDFTFRANIFIVLWMFCLQSAHLPSMFELNLKSTPLLRDKCWSTNQKSAKVLKQTFAFYPEKKLVYFQLYLCRCIRILKDWKDYWIYECIIFSSAFQTPQIWVFTTLQSLEFLKRQAVEVTKTEISFQI